MSESQSASDALEFTLDLVAEHRGRGPADGEPCERIPRITKLLALAIKFEQMLAEGEVNNLAALARAGKVSRARLTQIMNLLDLAPAIQEHILYITCPAHTPDPIRERQLRELTKLVRWDQQQRRYEELRAQNDRKPVSKKGTVTKEAEA